MLVTVALRFLPANVKLYGLAGYALTATFGPVSTARLHFHSTVLVDNGLTRFDEEESLLLPIGLGIKRAH
jgi:hypothetical protein